MDALLQLGLIVLLAHLGGALAERIGQPRVTAELAVGAAIGVLLTQGDIAFVTEVFRASSATALVGQIGLALLMFSVGLEVGAGFRLSGSRRATVAVAVAAFVVPFAGGALLGLVSIDSLAGTAQGWRYALFCGLALSVTALPVMSHIVWSMGISGLAACRTSLGAAALTDVACWVVLLGVIAPAGDASSMWRAVLVAAGAGLGAWFLLRPLLRWLVLRGAVQGQDGLLAQGAVLSVILVCAWIAERNGLHAAIGAMLPGLLLGGDAAFVRRWQDATEGLLRLLLVPVFFVYAGMSIDLRTMGSAAFAAWLLAFVAVAVSTKFYGAYWAARASGVAPNDARVIGALMNTRGMMELILIKIGFDQGLINAQAYTILFMVALVTTLMAAPLVRRWTSGNAPGLVPATS